MTSTSERETAISDASAIASDPSVIGWFFLGFLLGLIGILIVYLRSPKIPVYLLADYTGDERYLYEKAYVDTLKGRQVTSTWVGFAVSVGAFLFFFGSFISALFGFSGVIQ
ncbi:MAG: hypothetical protein OXF08_03560 [Bacteroidetes bacterium]|nr:hypothetical protein [Bacteroidota bacterium]